MQLPRKCLIPGRAEYNCPSDPTLPSQGGAPANKQVAASSVAANFLVFGRVDEKFRFQHGQGHGSLTGSFADGASNTLLFAEKYAVTIGPVLGGCHWAYWGIPTYSAFFALDMDQEYQKMSNACGPVGPEDPRDSRFQWRPPLGNGDPAVCATAHRHGMNAAMADGSLRTFAPGIDKHAWWALVTPASRD